MMNYSYYVILLEPNNTNTNGNVNTVSYLIIFIFMVFIILLFISCIEKIIKYKKRPYPFIKINTITDETSNLLCPICIEQLTINIVKFKVCPHILHKKCSNQFLLHDLNKCPICRKNIYTEPRNRNRNRTINGDIYNDIYI